jgi:hypothetical protein
MNVVITFDRRAEQTAVELLVIGSLINRNVELEYRKIGSPISVQIMDVMASGNVYVGDIDKSGNLTSRRQAIRLEDIKRIVVQ